MRPSEQEPSETSKRAPADGALPGRPGETGGRGGLDLTRGGEWEKDGRCIDF